MAETEAKKRTGLGALADAGNTDDFSVIDAIGGPRGVIESMLPGVVFVALFVITSNLQLTIGVSAALAVLQVIVRLCQRQSVMGAVSGLLAVGICLIWAWNSHEARNYYMFGFLTNAFYVVLLTISLLVRVPGLGLVIEFIRTLPTEHFVPGLPIGEVTSAQSRLYHHHRNVGWSVRAASDRAGAALSRQSRRLAGNSASADGHSVLGARDLGLVSDRGDANAPT